MSFVEILQLILPLLLYVAGFVLLVVLIIFCIKLIKTLNMIDSIMLDVEKKVKSLNGIFNVIDYFTDKISSITDIIVEKITNWVLRLKHKKYNKEEENEDE